MPKVIISDTSCFIILSKIDELRLLQQVYGVVITTAEIAMEYGDNLPEWVKVKKVDDKRRQTLLEMQP